MFDEWGPILFGDLDSLVETGALTEEQGGEMLTTLELLDEQNFGRDGIETMINQMIEALQGAFPNLDQTPPTEVDSSDPNGLVGDDDDSSASSRSSDNAAASPDSTDNLTKADDTDNTAAPTQQKTVSDATVNPSQQTATSDAEAILANLAEQELISFDNIADGDASQEGGSSMKQSLMLEIATEGSTTQEVGAELVMDIDEFDVDGELLGDDLEI